MRQTGETDALVVMGGAIRTIPVVAAAFEFVHYPRLKALNVVALAGEPLEFRGAFDGYWRQLTEFARSCGCARIEAKCSRAMARLLRAGYGFATVYEHVGIDLPTETKE